MPSVAELPPPRSNIHLAASDGDISLVRAHLGSGVSANAHDANGYTPMHAAASYGHLHLLEILVAAGGDVNVRDFDGDTPLYVVEEPTTAAWLLEHGASLQNVDEEGLTPLQYHLQEDEYPQVIAYLQARSGTVAAAASATATATAAAAAGTATGDGESAVGSAGMSTMAAGAEAADMSYDNSGGYTDAQLASMDGLPAEVREQIGRILSTSAADGVDRDDELRKVLEDALRGRADIVDAVANEQARETARRRA